ncbi:LuxR C-terminal-related transcriptional regulator [Lysobacter sp. S4-A87]|uniref:ATP-binding protein n=1 Tax=Lysobacter sp. S4-A87 TaxID=2925843 RepID=UPI001F532986|nr:helix-turn-helix transcriptional regulator [Lysobacter sp. S4-A87]UNK50154.1 LuxR C-terminal-related transcriptional regulator [Lysobacter sp. S4-A87]
MELIERGNALSLLQGALEVAGQGAGRTALVCGEAGIGKTSLLTQLVAGHGAGRVLWGGCEALFSPRPLGPLYDMASAMGSKLQALLGLEGHRTELFSCFLAELQQASDPTIVVLEDLHWADAATLDLVKFLARRIQRVRALLVLTYRDDELGDRHPLQLVLGDLPADAVVRVPLLPLSEAGVAELARQSSHPAEGIYATTGGNPFFVTEALRAEGLPVSVRDAVLARAARQTPEVRALLDLVAIVPARIEIDIVEAVLSPAPDDVAAALASGLLVADGSAYAFRHELARIAVEQALPAPLAAALHARVLAFLEQAFLEQRGRAVAMSRLVHHASGAGDTDAVLKYALQAGNEAANHGAHCEAATLYGAALAHADALAPAARAELLEDLSYQCYLVEQNDDAIAMRLEALAIWRKLGDLRREGRTLRWLSRLNWFGGRRQEAEEYANQAVHLLRDFPDDEAYAWALSNRSQLYMLSGHTDESVEWGTRAIELATRIGSNEVLAHSLNNVGTARYAEGDDEGKAMIEQSLRISLANDFEEHVARCYANLVSTAVKLRDYAQAKRHIEASAGYFAARDLDSWTNYIRAWQARLDFECGNWDAAANEALRLVTAQGVAPVTRICALAVLARLRQRRGDPGARELLDEATVLSRQSGELQRLAPVAAAHAEAAWLRNDGGAVDELVAQAHAMAEQRRDTRSLGELRYWCLRLGVAEGGPDGTEPPYALQIGGLWQQAAAEWARLGCPYEQALALLEGDESAMREALSLLEGLGANAAAKRCREHLREAGVRGLARGPRAATSANPAGLTPREMQILELLADGLSNADIARRLVRSEKTVDHHISAILRKLDVRSRSEAAAVARRTGFIAAGSAGDARG